MADRGCSRNTGHSHQFSAIFMTDNLKTERLKMITQSELKSILEYDPETGFFTWLCNKGKRVKIGMRAGSINGKGYVTIQINGKKQQAHRLAWLYMEGYWPEHDIDHERGIKHDNRWKIIKHVSHTCNMQNKKIYKQNSTGFPGVFRDKRYGRFYSYITVNKKRTHLGCYLDPLEAALARLTIEMQCEKWKCNHLSELTKAIKSAWPEFATAVGRL